MKQLTAEEVLVYLENLKAKGHDLSKYTFTADVLVNQNSIDITGMYLGCDTTIDSVYMVCNGEIRNDEYNDFEVKDNESI